jgi:hypothetical protein
MPGRKRKLCCVRGSEQQSSGYSQMDGQHDTHQEHVYLLRSLLVGALSVTGLLYGLGVYYGLSSAQTDYAGKEFKSLAAQAGQDIRKSFANSASSLNYVAERFATTFPNEADWPTVMLPGFVKDLTYLRDTTGFDSLVFAPIVQFDEINSTERFLIDAWAADPLTRDRSYFPVPGIYGQNQSARSVYADTRDVEWDAKYKVRVPNTPTSSILYTIYYILYTIYYELYTITNLKPTSFMSAYITTFKPSYAYIYIYN